MTPVSARAPWWATVLLLFCSTAAAGGPLRLSSSLRRRAIERIAGEPIRDDALWAYVELQLPSFAARHGLSRDRAAQVVKQRYLLDPWGAAVAARTAGILEGRRPPRTRAEAKARAEREIGLHVFDKRREEVQIRVGEAGSIDDETRVRIGRSLTAGKRFEAQLVAGLALKKLPLALEQAVLRWANAHRTKSGREHEWWVTAVADELLRWPSGLGRRRGRLVLNGEVLELLRRVWRTDRDQTVEQLARLLLDGRAGLVLAALRAAKKRGLGARERRRQVLGQARWQLAHEIGWDRPRRSAANQIKALAEELGVSEFDLKGQVGLLRLIGDHRSYGLFEAAALSAGPLLRSPIEVFKFDDGQREEPPDAAAVIKPRASDLPEIPREYLRVAVKKGSHPVMLYDDPQVAKPTNIELAAGEKLALVEGRTGVQRLRVVDGQGRVGWVRIEDLETFQRTDRVPYLLTEETHLHPNMAAGQLGAGTSVAIVETPAGRNWTKVKYQNSSGYYNEGYVRASKVEQPAGGPRIKEAAWVHGRMPEKDHRFARGTPLLLYGRDQRGWLYLQEQTPGAGGKPRYGWVRQERLQIVAPGAHLIQDTAASGGQSGSPGPKTAPSAVATVAPQPVKFPAFFAARVKPIGWRVNVPSTQARVNVSSAQADLHDDSGKILLQLAGGTRVVLIELSRKNHRDWVRVYARPDLGWMRTKDLASVQWKDLMPFETMIGAYLHDAPPTGGLKPGDLVNVQQKGQRGWREVTGPGGKSGWVNGNDINPASNQTIRQTWLYANPPDPNKLLQARISVKVVDRDTQRPQFVEVTTGNWTGWLDEGALRLP